VHDRAEVFSTLSKGEQGASERRTVEAVPRVAQAVPRSERLCTLPLRLVDVRRPDQGAPACDGVGCAQGERDERARGGVLDEAGEVEAACGRGGGGGVSGGSTELISPATYLDALRRTGAERWISYRL